MRHSLNVVVAGVIFTTRARSNAPIRPVAMQFYFYLFSRIVSTDLHDEHREQLGIEVKSRDYWLA